MSHKRVDRKRHPMWCPGGEQPQIDGCTCGLAQERALKRKKIDKITYTIESKCRLKAPHKYYVIYKHSTVPYVVPIMVACSNDQDAINAALRLLQG